MCTRYALRNLSVIFVRVSYVTDFNIKYIYIYSFLAYMTYSEF